MKLSHLLIVCATIIIVVVAIGTSIVLSSSYSSCDYRANGHAASCTWSGLR